MQRSQVFKVKGMQRDASMANANGDFAYEIVNMRLMPAEEGAGFSLTNEKGTKLVSNIPGRGKIIGQCPTKDSIIIFFTDPENPQTPDTISKLYPDNQGNWECRDLYNGNLGFVEDSHIEALFNYETEDIQKVYWIDGINQLRCINITKDEQYNDTSFDTIKELSKIPKVELKLSSGGNFTSGVLQYYITYFNKFSSESPVLYTSPLLYIANKYRGANTNDGISTAYRLLLTDLDRENWEYVRIYATHRTSLEATPEGSIVAELKIPTNQSIDFTDYGSNRTSIDANDLHFVGGKFIVAGTMTAKDQVLFLGNLKIDQNKTLKYNEINNLFAELRSTGDIDRFFSTATTKSKSNKLSEYEDKYYYHKSNLNNTEPITHYKYGEKYRFGISLMDKYGNWSNPIWIKDAFITVAPEQIDNETLVLPCPQLIISERLDSGKTLWEYLQAQGAKAIKPLVVFPSIVERKILAQGVVCPTVYNLKDRKENGPYAQASWFMRPNAPVDLFNLLGDSNVPSYPNHDSDRIRPGSDYGYYIYDSKYSIDQKSEATTWLDRKMSLIYDDLSILAFNETLDIVDDYSISDYTAAIKIQASDGSVSIDTLYDGDYSTAKDIITAGCWVEFRHNYALRTKGWTWGPTNDWYSWSAGIEDPAEWDHYIYRRKVEGTDISRSGVAKIGSTFDSDINGNFPKDTNALVTVDDNDYEDERGGFNRAIFYKLRLANSRCAELDTSRFGATIHVNRFHGADIERKTWRNQPITAFNTGNSAYYVDNSIVTLNSPEIELLETTSNISLDGYDFRIVGVIPLTATVSDISLETTGSIYNPSADQDISFGLKKVLVQNKNIGHHGFKGMVTHSVLYSGHNSPSNVYTFKDSGNDLTQESNALYADRYAAAFPLHPWQSTGNIPGFDPSWSDKNNYSKLQRKILSNLRYSASTKFLNSTWSPKNGSYAQWYTSSESSIIKLGVEGYSADLVYSANIDSIATATSGENNDNPIPIYQYFYGRKLVPTKDIKAVESSLYMGGACFDDVWKTGIGSSIKYKSSPHAVIGFNNIPVSIENTNLYTQEILPTFDKLNKVGRDEDYIQTITKAAAGFLYESDSIISMPHQDILDIPDSYGLPGYNEIGSSGHPTYGWLWLGELYKKVDPTFGGTTEYALENNSWELGGTTDVSQYKYINEDIKSSVTNVEGRYEDREGFDEATDYIIEWYDGTITIRKSDNAHVVEIVDYDICYSIFNYLYDNTINNGTSSYDSRVNVSGNQGYHDVSSALIKIYKHDSDFSITVTINQDVSTGLNLMALYDIDRDELFKSFNHDVIKWTIGDTYYQRFDTLKTYAYSDKDENSIIDITSFMVETRINIDGRYDRNRGQDSNLQMSPNNFNLLNDVYSQRDNFFTYRILDESVQNRINFPNQITWSLSKTAGATVDAWMNITLASILDLDGTKGNLTALRTFNDNIIAFQDSGISTILFNSRVQIPTSEYVPIQIANSGKVDGQQYLSSTIGCQDALNIVTTPNGLYFIDYYNKTIYRFNGQLEDISTSRGFRGWCEKNINSNSSIIGYYDRQNKEVMFFSPEFDSINNFNTWWLGYSELSDVFSSFYTYPQAILTGLYDYSIWIKGSNIYLHNKGDYNDLLGEVSPYGLTTIVRQDSNLVKIFNVAEFRADTYIDSTLRDFETFDTIQIEDEYNGRTERPLEYNQYRPTNLKKFLRTWRAHIPRVGNVYKRYVNQWAKVGLWRKSPSTEKTILHDIAVWYTE